MKMFSAFKIGAAHYCIITMKEIMANFVMLVRNSKNLNFYKFFQLPDLSKITKTLLTLSSSVSTTIVPQSTYLYISIGSFTNCPRFSFPFKDI